MKEINVNAGMRKHLPYTLVFGHNYQADPERRGTAVTSADLYASDPKIFFYVKTNQDDADNAAVIGHTSSSAAQITVDDTDPLTITVKLERADTLGEEANGLYYELSCRMLDGSYMLFEKGRMNILDSLNQAA